MKYLSIWYQMGKKEGPANRPQRGTLQRYDLMLPLQFAKRIRRKGLLLFLAGTTSAKTPASKRASGEQGQLGERQEVESKKSLWVIFPERVSVRECETNLANSHRAITDQGEPHHLHSLVSRDISSLVSGWSIYHSSAHNICAGISRATI